MNFAHNGIGPLNDERARAKEKPSNYRYHRCGARSIHLLTHGVTHRRQRDRDVVLIDRRLAVEIKVVRAAVGQLPEPLRELLAQRRHRVPRRHLRDGRDGLERGGGRRGGGVEGVQALRVAREVVDAQGHLPLEGRVLAQRAEAPAAALPLQQAGGGVRPLDGEGVHRRRAGRGDVHGAFQPVDWNGVGENVSSRQGRRHAAPRLDRPCTLIAGIIRFTANTFRRSPYSKYLRFYSFIYK